MALPLLSNFALMLTKWKSSLDPLLSNALVQGQQLTAVALTTSATSVFHGLGRTQQGWFITDINAAATIYRTGTFNDTNMVLTASAACTVNIWVF